MSITQKESKGKEQNKVVLSEDWTGTVFVRVCYAQVSIWVNNVVDRLRREDDAKQFFYCCLVVLIPLDFMMYMLLAKEVRFVKGRLHHEKTRSHTGFPEMLAVFDPVSVNRVRENNSHSSNLTVRTGLTTTVDTVGPC